MSGIRYSMSLFPESGAIGDFPFISVLKLSFCMGN